MAYMDARLYIIDAIKRLESGQVSSGSHLDGIYGKAAKQYEQKIRNFLKRVLNSCGVEYETRIRAKISGKPPFIKLTLGQIIKCFEYLSEYFPNSLTLNIPTKSFIRYMKVVNKEWVNVKHGEGISENEASKCLEAMLLTIDVALEP